MDKSARNVAAAETFYAKPQYRAFGRGLAIPSPKNRADATRIGKAGDSVGSKPMVRGCYARQVASRTGGREVMRQCGSGAGVTPVTGPLEQWVRRRRNGAYLLRGRRCLCRARHALPRRQRSMLLRDGSAACCRGTAAEHALGCCRCRQEGNGPESDQPLVVRAWQNPNTPVLVGVARTGAGACTVICVTCGGGMPGLGRPGVAGNDEGIRRRGPRLPRS